MLTPILMAGGNGTRLWPLSRKEDPKQLHPLLDKESLLQKSATRLIRGFGAERLWVTTTRDHFARIARELPEIRKNHITVEPLRRETAPAFGLALVRVRHEDPDAVIVYSNADNYVRDVPEFLRILKVTESLVRAEPDRIALVGVRPTYPETGYGYIRMGNIAARIKRKNGKGEDEVMSVRAFVEKPDLAKAKRFFESWEYLWNPTLIVARVSTLLDRYQKHLPAVAARLAKIESALGTKREAAVIEREFRAMPAIDINRGILEKEKGMLVVPADFGWVDVGSWKTVHDVLAKEPKHTIAKGPHLARDSSGNILVSTTGKLIATIGVHDMAIVETEDAILVCPKNRSQEVKALVEELVQKKLKKYL